MEHDKIYTGEEFKKLYPDIKLYKSLRKRHKTDSIQFKIGENINSTPFGKQYSKRRLPSPFYLYRFEHIFGKYNIDDFDIGIVEIPDDSLITIQDGVYEINKFIMTNIINSIEFINLPEISELAVSHCNCALKFIKNQTEKLCKIAVRKNGLSLKFVREQTIEICEEAINQNPDALRFVKEQTYDLCKMAVQKDGYVLKYVKEQTDDICMTAVQQQVGLVLKYVKNQTDEICRISVQRNGYSLKYVKEQTYDICKIAVQEEENALKYVKDQTDEICKIAIAKNVHTINYVRTINDSISEFACQHAGSITILLNIIRSGACENLHQSMSDADESDESDADSG